MSLRDGSKKMSKSDPNEMSRIELADPADLIQKKIQKAVTDSEDHISYDPKARPAISNLINIYSDLSGLTTQAVCEKYQNMEKCKSIFKADLTELVVSKLTPVQDNVTRIRKDVAYVDNVLQTGADQAKNIAAINLLRIKEMLGLQWFVIEMLQSQLPELDMLWFMSDVVLKQDD